MNLEPLISIIMSVYNESIEEISTSINSIINQSYKNLEIIIIDDKPNNTFLYEFLEKINDKRIILKCNKNNEGLVKSLNKALLIAKGSYIARMDADDISLPFRIEDELKYLRENKLDIVGSNVALIDIDGNTIQTEMRMPKDQQKIIKYMKWGSCICHPTWLVDKKVYDKLGGYRDTPYCEDYDFLWRTIKEGFKLGNIQKVELHYRVRGISVSSSNYVNQYLLRRYLSKKYRSNVMPNENDVDMYLQSTFFQIEKNKLQNYRKIKQQIKNGNLIGFWGVLLIMFNKFFWIDIEEKIALKIREKQ